MDGQALDHALDVLGSAKYVSLTTFRRDGTPVPTPVWIARDGGRLLVITGAASGKVKRLRHTARVVVAPCDMRGRVTGSAFDATAHQLDEEGTATANSLISAKYGLMAKLMGLVERLQRRSTDRIGIEINL